jgi:hypothetical protein
LLFFGGALAWTVGDGLYPTASRSPFLAVVAAALCFAGIAMVLVSVWMAVGAQLRRMRL